MTFYLCVSGCGRYLAPRDGHERCIACLCLAHAEAAFVDESCSYPLWEDDHLGVASLKNRAPSYLKVLLITLSSTRHLRSTNRALLSVPRSRFKTKGDRAFSVNTPRLWNQLPLDCRLAPSITSFRSRLKTYIYFLAFLSQFIDVLLDVLFACFLLLLPHL